MNYSLKIKMSYNGLGGNPDGNVERYVQADLQDVKMISENVGGGRRRDELSGNILINNENGDYDAFDTYMSDSGYYVSPKGFEITELKVNGTDILYNQLSLIEINKDTKELKFKLSGDCVNEYTNVYAAWDTKRNVLAGVASPSAPVKDVAINDVRTLYDTGTTVDVTFITVQAHFENYVNTLIDSETDKQIYRVKCTAYNGITKAATFDLYWRQWRADGYDNGGDYEPPAGADWVYRTVLGGIPKYKKRPKYLGINFVEWAVTSTDQYVDIEGECNIIYGDGGVRTNRTLEDVVEYLFSQADNSIAFNANSWSGFSITGAGTFNTAFNFLRDGMLFIMSDFIPTDSGNQKDTAATKGYLSLEILWRYLEQYGIFWYLEESGGTYYLVTRQIEQIYLGTSNPSITEHIIDTRKIEIIDAEYDKLTNSSSGSTYDFRMPEYTVQAGENSKAYQENEIVTDVDYIFDQKSNVFDEDSGEQWVLVSTTKNVSTLDYDVRYFTSGLTGVKVNNYEHSFYFLSKNVIPKPVQVGSDGTNYGYSQVKRKRVEIVLPVDNPQTDFNFYDSVDYFDETAEIERIEKGLLETEATMILKFR